MKANTLILLIAIMSTFSGFAQDRKGEVQIVDRVDTLYYDSDWKVINHPAFAEFYRIALYPADTLKPKKFRDFYIDGTLQATGEFLYIDPTSDENTIFSGECINYFKNGKKQSVKTYNDGLLNGEYTIYQEDGLVKKVAHFNMGKLNGLYTEFRDDGHFVQLEYIDGKPATDFYLFGDSNGRVSKISRASNEVIWESPDESERQVVYKDGTTWQVYSNNGLTICLTNTTVNDYGKWHKVDILIVNNSLVPIDFEPTDCISALSIDKNNYITELKVWSCDEYMKKVNRAQIWAAVAVGLSEGLAAANAGYTTSTTTSSAHYSGYTNSYGTSSVYGRGGYAYGSYTGNSNYAGSIYGTSTTTTYDANAAYRAQVASQMRMQAFGASLDAEKHAKKVGYLKHNTIGVGESVQGYVHIQRVRGQKIYIHVNINGAVYKYDWSYGK